jgi:ammonium transporter Rh
MMLIGFGFLMTFIRTHSWSALSYTFFINAIVIELYILLKAFWQRIFHGFDLLGTTIKIDQLILT